MWICSPEFLKNKPFSTFHRQLEQHFSAPPHPDHLKNFHWLVRKTFLFTGRECALEISADDYFKCFLNGRRILQGPAQAYPGSYPFLRFDLRPFLRPGKNVLALHVYYHGCLNSRAWQSGDFRQGAWFRAVDSCGNTLWESDRDSRAARCRAWQQTETIGYDTQFVEKIRGDLISPDWNTVDFDDSLWEPAAENPFDDHTLVPQQTRPVFVRLQQPAKLKWRDGVLFGDMGEEVTGSVTFLAAAASRRAILVRCGEELNKDGSVRYRMRCNCNYENEWQLSGRETDLVEFYDYMAFRYFEIHCPANTVFSDTVCAEIRHYPMQEESCVFQTDDPQANQIFEICRRGVMLGTQEAFLDCPSREKGQYLGDGTITAHAHLLLTGDPAMYRKMLFDFAASAQIDPGLMAVAPGNEMQEIADYSCQYPEQLLTYYRMTGDTDTLRRLMPVVDGVERYFDAHRNDNGLIENLTGKWNLVDWPENLRDDYDFELSQPIGPGVHNVINAFYYGLKKNADEIRALLGLPLRNELGALRRAFFDAFRKDDGLFRDAVGSEHSSLHACALPLYYGITAETDIPATVRLIQTKGLCCGVYMAYFVLKALVRAGRKDIMAQLLLNNSDHSWKNMLREGATTCFEAWGKEQKWNTSLCHPWASAPVILLLEDIAGIQTERPGVFSFGHPFFPDGITSIHVKISTPHGTLKKNITPS